MNLQGNLQRTSASPLAAAVQLRVTGLVYSLAKNFEALKFSENLERDVGFICCTEECLGPRLLNPKECAVNENLLRARTHSVGGAKARSVVGPT